jgi:hypothetical protein
MFEGKTDDSQCRFCGNKLSLIQRLSRSGFCSANHRSEYQRRQEELALERLGLNKQKAGPPTPPPAPPPEPELELEPADTDQHYESFIIEEAPEDETQVEDPAPAFASFVYLDAVADYTREPCLTDSQALDDPFWHLHHPDLEIAGTGKQWSPPGDTGLAEVARLVRGITASAWLDPSEEDPKVKLVYPPAATLIPFSLDECGTGTEAEGPPLAGPVPMSGPQSLRFEPCVSRPEPAPEELGTSPSAGVRYRHKHSQALRMAASVRGVWKTRFGQEGSLTPVSGDSSEPILEHGEIDVSLPRFCPDGRVLSAALPAHPHDEDDFLDVEGDPLVGTAPETVSAAPGAGGGSAEKHSPSPVVSAFGTRPLGQGGVERPSQDEASSVVTRTESLADAGMRAEATVGSVQVAPGNRGAGRQGLQEGNVELAWLPEGGSIAIPLSPASSPGTALLAPAADLIWYKLKGVRDLLQSGLRSQVPMAWLPQPGKWTVRRGTIATLSPAGLIYAPESASRVPDTPAGWQVTPPTGKLPIAIACPNATTTERLAGSRPAPERGVALRLPTFSPAIGGAEEAKPTLATGGLCEVPLHSAAPEQLTAPWKPVHTPGTIASPARTTIRMAWSLGCREAPAPVSLCLKLWGTQWPKPDFEPRLDAADALPPTQGRPVVIQVGQVDFGKGVPVADCMALGGTDLIAAASTPELEPVSCDFASGGDSWD